MARIGIMHSAPSSRIPVPVPRDRQTVLQRTTSAPSKLEKIQRNFQQKVMRDKEEKMIRLYEDHRDKALIRVGSNAPERGHLRDFFKDRRALENNHTATNIHHHYSQVKAQRSGRNSGRQRSSPSLMNSPHAAKPPIYVKNNYGRDKSKPLAPIEKQPPDNNVNFKKAIHHPKPPPVQQKPALVRVHRRRPSRGTPVDSDTDGANDTTASARSNTSQAPLNTTYPVKKKKLPERPTNYESSDEDSQPILNGSHSASSSAKSKTTSFREWQKQQRERQANQQAAIVNSEEVEQPQAKPTGYAAYHAEQEKLKRERLEKLRAEQSTNAHTYDGDDWTTSGTSSRDTRKQNSYAGQKSNRAQNKRAPLSERETAMNQQNSARNQKAQSRQQLKQNILKRQNSRLTEDNDSSDASEDVDDVEAAEIKKQEAALKALIEKQQAELTKMKVQREKELEQERKAEERERKRREEQKKRRDSLRKAELTQGDSTISEPDEERNHRQPSRSNSRSRKQPSPEEDPFPSKPIKARRQPAPSVKPVPRYEPKVDEKNEAVAAYLQMAEGDPDAAPQDIQLVPCNVCGRKFAADRIAKHSNACGQSSSKKRKVFDPVKMRVEGTDHAQYQGRGQAPPKPAKKKDWKREHEEFIKTIRYAKKVTEVEKQGGNLADLPPPPKSENPDYVPCPHCGRKFNNSAAERHIPRCQALKNKPKPFNTKRR